MELGAPLINATPAATVSSSPVESSRFAKSLFIESVILSGPLLMDAPARNEKQDAAGVEKNPGTEGPGFAF